MHALHVSRFDDDEHLARAGLKQIGRFTSEVVAVVRVDGKPMGVLQNVLDALEGARHVHH